MSTEPEKAPAGPELADVARYAACPFCGEDWLIITMGYEGGKHFVACQCGAQGPLCDGPMEAKAAWELRHNARNPATGSNGDANERN